MVDDVDPGSRMLPIGGFTAKVTPKYRGSIELAENQEYKDGKEVIALYGFVTPALSGQAVQVVLTDPHGRLRVMNTTTVASPAGRFYAVFDLTRAPSDDPVSGEPGPPETPLAGVYKTTAYIVNAAAVSQAESNEVIINR